MRCIPYESEKIIYSNGNYYFWYIKNKQKQSFNDQPAYVGYKSLLVWYKEGRQHRGYNRPAVMDMDAEEYFWYIDGKLVKQL